MGNRLFTMENPIEKPSRPAPKQDTARRTADNYFVAWERRTTLVKQQVATESAANDAKTAKLRVLRLAKEAADREAELLNPAPKKPVKKRALKTEA